MKKKETLPLLTSLTLASVVYYRLVSGEPNLITGIILLLAVCAFVFFVSESTLRLLRCSDDTKGKIRLLLITTSILLIGAELFLRFGLSKYSTYSERNGSKNYSSLYDDGGSSRFHVYKKNERLDEGGYSKQEFAYSRTINSLGLAEKEIDLEKTKNEFRVVALGDSFTEGVGTTYDSTWVKVVEQNLAKRFPDKKITTMNAGISGSDVCFEYVLLKDRLLSFHPDLVIVATNTSDVTDVITRGGFERFQGGDGRVSFRKAPNWEWIYSISYIFRHVIHDAFQYNWVLIKQRDMAFEQRKAVKKIRAAIDEFERLARENRFDLLIVFHPMEHEVKGEEYDRLPFNNLIYDLKNEHRRNFVDLLDYWKRNKLITKENSSEFFWRIDLHHNARGYEVMGNSIANKIFEMKLMKPGRG